MKTKVSTNRKTDETERTEIGILNDCSEKLTKLLVSQQIDQYPGSIQRANKKGNNPGNEYIQC